MAAALETMDHTNCVEVGLFTTGGPQAGVEQLQVLAMVGDRAVILSVPACDVPAEQVESEVTFWLQRVKNAGYLKNIVAIRPCDEPDDRGIIDELMKAIILSTHKAMAKFEETIGKPIAVFYTCGGKTRPGIEYVDWMGCDRYDHGCNVFPEAYGLFMEYVNKEPDRKLMAISGGSNPTRQDPSCFVAQVNADARYALLEGFAWQTIRDRGNTYVGISVNGMRQAYCEAGKKIMNPNLVLHC